jgi:hypothetical protein
MTTIVKAEDTTIIKRDRDRDGEGDKTVIKKRKELKVLPSKKNATNTDPTRRKNARASSWLGLAWPLFV